MHKHISGRMLLVASAGLALSLALVGTSLGQDPVTVTFNIANEPTGLAAADSVIKAFEAQNPDIKIEIETRANDASGDNLIKTRLATGEMNDIFLYNTGSLFQALNPEKTLVDLTQEPFQANTLDSFKSTVTTNGHLYGAPDGTAMGGGVLYNKKVFAKLGLSVPKSWAEFMANNKKIKDAGIPPVIQTFGTSWTAQLFVLGDFHKEPGSSFPQR